MTAQRKGGRFLRFFAEQLRSISMCSPPLNPSTLPTSLNSLVTNVAERFNERFGEEPTWVVAAPGRVNLIGEHIDYNDGFVLPMAIDRYVTIAAAATPGDAADAQKNSSLASNAPAVGTFYSANLEETTRIPFDHSLTPGESDWPCYVAGVCAGLLENGHQLPSINAVIESNVPLGSGLSSSAALEVATATLAEAILGLELDQHEKALLCQKAEHRFAGVPCGIMDQYSSVFGVENALMLLDCRSQQIESIPFASSEVSVLITNSNVKHELTGGEYAERREQCESAARHLEIDSWRDLTMSVLESSMDRLSEVEYRRSRHVVSEIARTTQAAEAIRAGAWAEAGELMYSSHDSLRDDYEVSCRELDCLVEIAREIGPSSGVIGSRMTGGGFGGCTVTLVYSDKVDEVAIRLSSRYLEKTGIQAKLFASRPSRGAHIVRG